MAWRLFSPDLESVVMPKAEMIVCSVLLFMALSDWRVCVRQNASTLSMKVNFGVGLAFRKGCGCDRFRGRYSRGRTNRENPCAFALFGWSARGK